MPVISIPAPVGGMNRRDSYAAFPITDAMYLYDMIPRAAHVETAPPAELYYNDAAQCHGLYAYEADGVKKLVGAFGSGASWKLKNITDPNAPADLAIGFFNGRFIGTMFQSYLILCNGEDAVQVFDGTAVAAATITGVSSATLRGCITFKGRVFYWQKESQSFWYAGAGSYQGALTEFPCDTFTTRGGKIRFLSSWTRDGGDGADDLFFVVFDTGEMLVYKGDDPDSATAWEMVGRFDMPQPIGPNSARRVGANTLFVTKDGIVDPQKIMGGDPYPLITLKIDGLASFNLMELTETERDLISILDIPECSSILLNDLSTCDGAVAGFISSNLALNKQNGAWWIYPSQPAAGGASDIVCCGCVWDGRTYLGRQTTGTVYLIAAADLNFTSVEETASQVWRPVSGNAFAFAPGVNDKVQTSFSFPLVDSAIGAFVQPFGGLSGNVTAIQTIKGTRGSFWSGKDQVRWYKTNLRVKPGGKK